MPFHEAKKIQASLKIALYGPSGSGKTMGALKIATGLVGPKGRIAVIDSERGSSALYAKRHAVFDLDILESSTPEEYIEKIKEAVRLNYDVLIIDQITSEWSSVKDSVDSADDKNKYGAWKGPSQLHQRFMNTMLTAPVHIIATMREKDDVVMSPNEKGKLEPMKLGVKPDQRKGIEYEFTTIFRIDKKHVATVEKDRTEMFDSFADPLSQQVGAMFLDWLSGGEETSASRKASQEKKNKVFLLLSKLNTSYDSPKTKERFLGLTGKESMTFWLEEDADKVIQVLEESIQKKFAETKGKSKPKAGLNVPAENQSPTEEVA